ncbi:STAS domain-containing protein [Conexibacter stalactiti]|uniref:STAS domain-containing protein n=1 Tax=Conexibacter stalactiti TaxID=1940611 RepID=A0ABU4HLK3_9ACTN|nr:STAS domain-containing protein [Conexibacter stalactiti]MDW5594167.1 STAS domain-containing protein [Conexibacter stalactiti]MEC5034809.1 STAS domain-containing protein [Conexibacter stalactiti]
MRVHLCSCADREGFVRFARIVDYGEHPPTLRCSGDEDRATQARRRPALARAIKAPADVAIDLTDLTWADASLMLDFVMLARRLRAQGRTVALRNAQPQIIALIELVGLDRLQGVSVERATAALPGTAGMPGTTGVAANAARLRVAHA